MKNILNKFEINIFTYILFFITLLSGFYKNLIIIYIIVLFHEFGHIFFFVLFNIKIEKVVLYPFGGITYANFKYNEFLLRNILCALGGIMFQLLLFFLFLILFKINVISFYSYNLFLSYNKIIILFNLIPIIPLDGNKILFFLLKKFLPFKCCYYISFITSIIFLFFFHFYYHNVISIFLLFCSIKYIIDYKFSYSKFIVDNTLA